MKNKLNVFKTALLLALSLTAQLNLAQAGDDDTGAHVHALISPIHAAACVGCCLVGTATSCAMLDRRNAPVVIGGPSPFYPFHHPSPIEGNDLDCFSCKAGFAVGLATGCCLTLSCRAYQACSTPTGEIPAPVRQTMGATPVYAGQYNLAVPGPGTQAVQTELVQVNPAYNYAVQAYTGPVSYTNVAPGYAPAYSGYPNNGYPNGYNPGAVAGSGF